jgi:hypothetical protein
MQFYHSLACGGHFGPKRIARKVLESVLFWPTLFRDSNLYCKSCVNCQKIGSLGHRDQMPLTPILVCEIFNVWGIDFMGPFPSSFGSIYILLAIDYVSKWVKAKATKNNDAKTVINFVQTNIFVRFGTHRAIISYCGTHLCNKVVDALFKKLELSTAHQQPTILRRVDKLKSLIARLSPFLKRL